MSQKQKDYRIRQFLSNDFFVTRVVDCGRTEEIRQELTEIFAEIYNQGGAAPARKLAMAIYPFMDLCKLMGKESERENRPSPLEA